MKTKKVRTFRDWGDDILEEEAEEATSAQDRSHLRVDSRTEQHGEQLKHSSLLDYGLAAMRSRLCP